MEEVIDKNITYASLITTIATTLNTLLQDSAVSAGIFRDNSRTITIGTDHTAHDVSSETTNTLSDGDNRSEYIVPSIATITTDLTTFMNALSIPTSNTSVTISGLMSFIFASNYFAEKAIIKQVIYADDNTITYHNHYSPPSSSGYTKLPYTYSSDDNLITSDKITDIFKQLQSTNMLSDNARAIGLTSAAHASSSSSSSSSSSCSSSSFIIYFKL